tara:strand:- start:507 stop:1088 length:582 start_codon:yes stop_codon:yes gene_type:complete
MTVTKTKKTTITTEKPIETLPTNPFIFEVLELASKQRSNVKKVEVLKTYDDASLKTILIWNFDETVISLLPEGDVPYASTGEQTSYSGTLSSKVNDAVFKMNELGSNSLGSMDQGKSSIRKEYQMFFNFVKGGNNGLSSLRRETMFINILQGLHPKEAELLCLVKDKKLSDKYKITLDNVKEAYPDIQWGGRS